MAFVIWLLSPYTRGASLLYRKFVHPTLSRKEKVRAAWLWGGPVCPGWGGSAHRAGPWAGDALGCGGSAPSAPLRLSEELME